MAVYPEDQLRQKMEAVEGMADMVRRFEEMRAQGKFVSGKP